jgi:hypothetical protein
MCEPARLHGCFRVRVPVRGHPDVMVTEEVGWACERVSRPDRVAVVSGYDDVLGRRRRRYRKRRALSTHSLDKSVTTE